MTLPLRRMLPLIGIAVVVLGFAFRVNPLLVVATAAVSVYLQLARIARDSPSQGKNQSA